MESHLIDRLTFQEDDLFLDGKKIFFVPAIRQRGIDVVACLTIKTDHYTAEKIWVGTGSCCHGHLYILSRMVGDELFEFEKIISVDTNCMDILPVVYDRDGKGYLQSDGVLVTGFGCSGAGVRLVGTTYPRHIDILSREEFEAFRERVGGNHPTFFVDRETNAIHLDFLHNSTKEGLGTRVDTRDPALVAYDGLSLLARVKGPRTMDLTPRLGDALVDLPRSLELLSGFRRKFYQGHTAPSCSC